MAKPGDKDPKLEVMDSLVRVAFTVIAVLNQAATAHDLSLTQLRTLAILRDREPKMAELASFLGLDRSSVSGLIDRAVARGLVRREISTDDGRAFQVILTAEGRALAEVMTAEVSELVAPLTGRLSPADQKRLSNLLNQLHA